VSTGAPQGLTRGKARGWLTDHGYSWHSATQALEDATGKGRAETGSFEILCRDGGYDILLTSTAVNQAAVLAPARDGDDQPSITLGGIEVFIWRQEDGSLGINVIREGADLAAWPADSAAGAVPRPAGTSVPVVLYDDSNIAAVWDDGAQDQG
jgi:hypothetical protein